MKRIYVSLYNYIGAEKLENDYINVGHDEFVRAYTKALSNNGLKHASARNVAVNLAKHVDNIILLKELGVYE